MRRCIVNSSKVCILSTHFSCSAGRRAGFSMSMSTCSLIQSVSTVKSPSAFMAAFSLRESEPLFFVPVCLSVRSASILPAGVGRRVGERDSSRRLVQRRVKLLH